ncbi:MAG: hypothetical protein JKY56_06590 [Kofleriaceae bacterium]|nr:hypothetical protein [Kofleriaceae bacterium]
MKRTYLLTVRNSLLFVGVILIVLCSSSLDAMAHLMPRGKGTLNVVGSKVYVVLSLPVEALYDAEFAKKRINHTELKQGEASLRQRVRKGVHLLSTASGESAVLDQILLSLPSGDGHDGVADEDLLVMIVARFETAPGAIDFSIDLWAKGSGGIIMKATVSEGKATLQSETRELSEGHPHFLFFSPESEVHESSLGHGLSHIPAGLNYAFLGVLLLLGGYWTRSRILSR